MPSPVGFGAEGTGGGGAESSPDLSQQQVVLEPTSPITGRYPSSSLLRGGPPLTGTLVRSASRVRRLGLFPWRHRHGSPVLPGSPGWSHVPCTPDATWPGTRLPPGCSPGIPSPLVVAVLSTRRQGFAYAHLSSPHLTGAPAFSMTLTPGALDPSRSWRFGASPCRATPKGLPSSSVQPRDAQGTRHLPRVLTDRMVFLGGCATGLLLTDPAAPEVRPTRDVDVITEVGSLAEYDRLADASGWPASSRIRVWARRSRPRTITWCRVSGASRRGWRGMVSRNVATECPEATSPLTKIGVQSLEASRDSRRE
jgi:hypothetical protein